MNNYNFLVRVSCMTYNHAPYIEDAMNGFCVQETTFPYVCIIVDDASTDGEPEVIKCYLKEHFVLDNEAVVRNEETEDYYLTFAQHKTNRNCFFAVFVLKYNHFSIKKSKKPYIEEWDDTKYIAFCEGDDYWIDPMKLQKQVGFMEDNEDYGLVYTNVKRFIQREKRFEPLIQNVSEGKITTNLLRGDFYLATLSVCYRSCLRERIDDSYLKQGFLMGDYPLWIELSMQTQFKFLPDCMCVYRILDESASHSKSLRKSILFKADAYRCSLYFINKYGFDDLYKIVYSNYLYQLALLNALDKQVIKGVKCYWKSSSHSLSNFVRFFTCFFKSGV